MARSKLTRRSFLQVSGGAIGLAALAACAAPVAPAAPAAEGGEEGGEAPLTSSDSLWVLHKQDFHPEYNDFMRAHIENFAAENNLALDVAFTSGFGGSGAEEQKIGAAVQAGDPPDVWIDNRAPFKFDQLGVLQDVSDLQAEVTAMYGEPAARPNKEVLSGEGYVGVVLHTRADGGWARQDVFEAAGIDIQAVRTFDQLREACLAVSDPDNGFFGWGMTPGQNGDGSWFTVRVIQGFGGTWADETGQYVTINSPETIAAIEWMVDTYTNEVWAPMLPPGVLAWTDTSNNEAYLGETLAYTQNGGTVYASAVANGLPVAEKTVYHKPVGGPVVQEFMGLGGMYEHLITGAKNATMGRDLILSFHTQETLEAMFNSAVSYALPAYVPQWEWELITANDVTMQMKDAALDPAGWNSLSWPGPNTAQMGAVDESNIDTDIFANVVNGSMTVAEAVEEAHRKAIGIFQEFGAPGE